MSVDIKPLPDGFLSKLLGEFGLQWTHLVILSGVVFSSFELQQYLNPGIWILGTVGSFSVVYLFRYQITGSFPKTAAYAGSALMIAVLAPWIALMLTHRDVGFYRKLDKAFDYVSGRRHRGTCRNDDSEL